MAIYLFDPSIFQQLYNCSLYSVDDVPLEERRHPILGAISIAFFLVTEILYIPCIFAISRYLKESCYKILFCISLMDFFALFFAGLLTGIFGIQGIVFCSAPRFVYSAGMIGNFFYGFETFASILLAANRCLETINSKTADRFFSGQKTSFWIGSVWLYSLYFAIFDKAIVFNSITYTWVFNPHMSYIDGIDNLYISIVDIVHEALVAILIPFFYFLFFIFLNKKQKMTTNNNQLPMNGGHGKTNQRKIFKTITNALVEAQLERYFNVEDDENHTFDSIEGMEAECVLKRGRWETRVLCAEKVSTLKRAFVDIYWAQVRKQKWNSNSSFWHENGQNIEDEIDAIFVVPYKCDSLHMALAISRAFLLSHLVIFAIFFRSLPYFAWLDYATRCPVKCYNLKISDKLSEKLCEHCPMRKMQIQMEQAADGSAEGKCDRSYFLSALANCLEGPKKMYNKMKYKLILPK